ncbi:hypothetical protein P0D91_00815 [Pseudomonas sp. CBSPBW29]|uniref:hypothetical protein n=1 Tax=Pseudomonas TaxID=286 RepID=UPI0021AC4643|nr:MULTISPECIES: hypothetical protein [unclassified Pseudomonas]WEL42954.1 hypothetical protein P0D91_00815 [Pseudomonas sp. CBSPBW29]WEL64024.1 hypothetical protein P0D93_28405 [Pseudomonas sp. CBSPGW29]WEL73213.1 hypothetical protein P0D94_14315 [Pseudomonas sp. CBSPCGW29]WEL74523.1 hypothetical protein P0D92_20365 [Pseudomonas sp. CBSPAW29]WEL81239.1 hypothetical protein P0D95_25460 [Pseudomonas sp. CBSPCAW29]WEL89740.1 hypothetical protein P0D90_07785 [Pseudomonas sp. CBSPCBW29]
MSIYEDLKRAYALKRLTNAFEGFVGLAPNEQLPAEQYARNTQVLSHWLDRLRDNSPQDITDTLFKQMKRAQRRGDARRFNCQTVLLELLVESNLALDLATYSAFIGMDEARQEGS